MMKKILIVDDDVGLLNIVQIILQKRNFVVYAISEWENMPTYINTFKPDLILLDIFLKGANGGALCMQLKGDKKTSHIPILLFSGDHDIETKFNDLGANGFIGKPFEVNGLVQSIESLLE